MEHREDPASGRAFHSADLSPLSLDELAVLSQAGDERASVALWRASDGIARRIARTWGVDDEHEWREALDDAFMVCQESWDPERASLLIEKVSNVDIAARLGIPVKHVHNCVSRHVRPATRRHAVEIRRADACIEETNQEPVNED